VRSRLSIVLVITLADFSGSFIYGVAEPLHQKGLLKDGYMTKFLESPDGAIATRKDERQTATRDYFRHRVDLIATYIDIQNSNFEICRMC
jgi:hypothetical protein